MLFLNIRVSPTQSVRVPIYRDDTSYSAAERVFEGGTLKEVTTQRDFVELKRVLA